MDSGKVPILFLWDGKWVRDSGRWKFDGDNAKSKVVWTNNDMSYEQMLDKVYDVTNINRDHHEIKMTCWFGYKCNDSVPPCPIIGDDDMQLLLEMNNEKRLSVPLCIEVINASTLSSAPRIQRTLGNTIVSETQPGIVAKDNPTINTRLDDIDLHDYDTYGSPVGPIEDSLVGDRTDPVVAVPDVNVVSSLNPQHVASVDPQLGPWIPPQMFVAPTHEEGGSNGVSAAKKKKTQPVHTPSNICSDKSSNPSSTGNSRAVHAQLWEGQTFMSKDELVKRLRTYSMLKNREFKVANSDTKRIIVKCVDPNCGWRVRGSIMKHTNTWQVRKFNSEHTCSVDVLQNSHCQATCNVLGGLIKYRFVNPTHCYPPAAIISEVKNHWGIGICYSKAWRAREVALNLVRGSPEESYSQLPRWLHRFKEINSGTVTYLDVDDQGHFKYCFISLGASIRGFLSHIRPVIAIDGTFLKGKYRGTLFLAVALDGNNQIYPLAYGIGDSENNDSWEWFLLGLRHAIGDVPELVFVSDRHKSIEKAVQKIFPNAFHGICLHHLRQNVVSKHKEPNIDTLLISAAYTYRETVFDQLMIEIEGASPDAYAYLVDAKYEKWSRVHSPARRYNMMTSNIAESMNSLLRKVREYPPVAVLEGCMYKLNNWFVKRREKASKMTSTLTKWAEDELKARAEESRYMEVTPIHTHLYNVHDGELHRQVDLAARTCSCKVFQLEQLPCEHALACCNWRNIPPSSLASYFYTSQALALAYSEPVFPVGNEEDWEIPDNLTEFVLHPHLMCVSAGRPKTNRRPSQGEQQVRRKCSRCGGESHNRQTCKNPIPLHPSTEPSCSRNDSAPS